MFVTSHYKLMQNFVFIVAHLQSFAHMFAQIARQLLFLMRSGVRNAGHR